MRVKGLSVSKSADLSIYLEHTVWLSNVVLVEIVWKPPEGFPEKIGYVHSWEIQSKNF